MTGWRGGAALGASALCLVLAGCKGTLREDYQGGDAIAALWVPEDPGAPLLGVVVQHVGNGGDVRGLRVERVLRDGPAEQAGVRPGDRLLRYGAVAVDTPEDLARAMALLDPTPSEEADASEWESPSCASGSCGSGGWTSSEDRAALRAVELTVHRDGREWVLPVQLVRQAEYARTAREGLDDARAAATEVGGLPLLAATVTWQIQPEDWAAYHGWRPSEPVVLYSEVDVLPVLGVFSLFRRETTPFYDDGARVQVLFWPLRSTSWGDGREYLASLRPTEEVAHEVH